MSQILVHPKANEVELREELRRLRNLPKEQPMADPQPLTLDEAFTQLFAALAIIKTEAMKPGFRGLAFPSTDGKTWAMPALVAYLERQVNFIVKAGGRVGR